MVVLEPSKALKYFFEDSALFFYCKCSHFGRVVALLDGAAGGDVESFGEIIFI